jgi:hypothetical protein
MDEPRITDQPPPYVQADLALLREALDHPATGIPYKLLDRNLIVADWPMTHFREVIASWHAEQVDAWVALAVHSHSAELDDPQQLKRDFHSIRLIAEIISRFDVVTLSSFSEVFGDSGFFKFILKVLGPDWGLMITDTKETVFGLGQRMAVIYDRRRVTPSGLVGDLRPSGRFADQDAMRPDHPFDWSPYLIGFRSGPKDFTIVFVNISSEDAWRESRTLVRWLTDARTNKQTWARNPIVIGFVDEFQEIFESAGLYAPFGFSPIFDDQTGFVGHSCIGWFQKGTAACPALKSTRHGFLNFAQIAAEKESAGSRVFQPDHVDWYLSSARPFWVEFSLQDREG